MIQLPQAFSHSPRETPRQSCDTPLRDLKTLFPTVCSRCPKDGVLLTEIVGIRRRSGKSEVKKTDLSGSSPFVDAPSGRIYHGL
jgi:hypothetical protein